jgi:hypothetical protein
MPRGDVGDQLALQWLPALAESDSRVRFAVQHLLAEGDPLVVARLIDVADNAAMRRCARCMISTGPRTVGRPQPLLGWRSRPTNSSI